MSRGAPQELILEVMRDSGQIMAPAVLAYQTEPEELWLPLLEMSRIFGIEFRDIGPLQYQLSQSNRVEVEVDFRCDPLDQRCLRHRKIDGLVYVGPSFWVSRFDLQLKFEPESLRILVLTGDPSQYVQGSGKNVESSAPLAGAKNSFPSFLLNARQQWSEQQSQPLRFEWYGEGVLADGIFSGQEQWASARRLRGGRVSWNRSEQASSSLTTDLLELGPPGWEVELFINDQYWDRTVVLSSGEFQFLQVPLPVGIVRFGFQFRGPAGQVFQREKQLGFAAQKKSAHELSFDVASFTDQVQNFAEVEYSPFQWGTLLRARHTQEQSFAEPMQALKLTQALGSFAISSEKVTRDQFHVATHQFEWRASKASLLISDEDLRHWQSPRYASGQTRESRLRLQHPGLLLPFWQWTLEKKEFEDDLPEQTIVGWRGVGRLGGILNVHAVQWQNEWLSQHELFFMKGLSQYRLAAASQAGEARQLEIGWQWNKGPQSTVLRTDGVLTFVGDEWLPSGSIGLGHPFEFFNASMEYQQKQTEWSVELIISTYLWPSSRSRLNYSMGAQHSLGMAELTVVHFEDINKNGQPDPGEPPLQDVRIRDLRTRAEHVSDSQGRLVLKDLPPQQNLTFEVALESVLDIELNPTTPTYFHRLRPHARAIWLVPWVRESVQ